MVELQHSFDVKWETTNFLEERVCEPIWDLLAENSEKLPKNANVRISLVFTPLR